MKKKRNPVLLYSDEHVICSEYNSNQNIGFIIHHIKAGECFTIEHNPRNHLFFFLEGKATVRYGDAPDFTVRENELFFLPLMHYLECIAETDLTFIIHTFDKVSNLCDKVALQSLTPFCDEIVFKIPVLPIRHPLDDFLSLLSIYLTTGMLCRHMHEVKQKELFLLLRAFYTKEENAALFAPIISESLDFKSAVIKNFPKAKNVQELADYCNCSSASFNRLFKKYFNTTPYQWIQQQKLNQVIAKLSDEDIPLSAIVDELDFSSPAHFTLFCKEHLNATPSQFRKESVQAQKDRMKKVYKK